MGWPRGFGERPRRSKTPDGAGRRRGPGRLPERQRGGPRRRRAIRSLHVCFRRGQRVVRRPNRISTCATELRVTVIFIGDHGTSRDGKGVAHPLPKQTRPDRTQTDQTSRKRRKARGSRCKPARCRSYWEFSTPGAGPPEASAPPAAPLRLPQVASFQRRLAAISKRPPQGLLASEVPMSRAEGAMLVSARCTVSGEELLVS